MNISNNPTVGFIVALAAVGGVVLGGAALSSSVSNKKAVEDMSARMSRELGGVMDVRSEVSALAGRTQGSLDEVRQEVWVLRTQVSNSLPRASAGKSDKKGEKTEKTEAAIAGPGTYHTIAAGESLGKVAKQSGTTVDAITKLNPGVDSSHLKIGQRIRVK